MSIITSPWIYWPQFNIGKPLFNGNIYIGIVGADPELPENQKDAIIIQKDGSQIAAEYPIKIGNGGVATYNGAPVAIDVTGDFSLKVTDSSGSQVYYIANYGEESEAILQATLQAVALLLNLPFDEIGTTLITNEEGTSLDGAVYLFDTIDGFIYELPDTIPVGATVVSNDGETLTTSAGDFTMTRIYQLDILTIKRAWQDVILSRAIGVTYTNTENYPISVSVSLAAASASAACALNFSIDGVVVARQIGQGSTSGARTGVVITVQPGSTYEVTTGTTTPNLDVWQELRV